MAVSALLQFADQLRTEDGGDVPGLFAGINVYGLADDPFLHTADEKAQRFVPLATFIASRSRLSELLNVPDREGDESTHFSDSADLSDNTIALVRQVEGRVKLYRNAIAICQRVRDALGGDIAGAQASLAAWDDRLAEARQDVAVTRALIAEENDRLGRDQCAANARCCNRMCASSPTSGRARPATSSLRRRTGSIQGCWRRRCRHVWPSMPTFRTS